MDISILQSLIKRNSNHIARCEEKLEWYLVVLQAVPAEEKVDYRRYVSIERSTIKMLARIQKLLKRDMAKMVGEMKHEKFLMRMRNK